MARSKIEWTDRVWISVPGASNYKANINGDILGPGGKILSPIASKSGHLYVFIYRQKRWVHRIVLEVFVGKCPEGMECRHLDGNPKNNRLENLAWGTRLQNAEDRRKHGNMPIPHESIFTRLKPSNIPSIRQLHKSGKSSRAIAEKFGTSHTTIQKIIRGERWKGY